MCPPQSLDLSAGKPCSLDYPLVNIQKAIEHGPLFQHVNGDPSMVYSFAAKLWTSNRRDLVDPQVPCAIHILGSSPKNMF